MIAAAPPSAACPSGHASTQAPGRFAHRLPRSGTSAITSRYVQFNGERLLVLSLMDEAIIVRMRADPEPDKHIVVPHRKGTVSEAYSS
jgi:hypothetical protein